VLATKAAIRPARCSRSFKSCWRTKANRGRLELSGVTSMRKSPFPASPAVSEDRVRSYTCGMPDHLVHSHHLP